MKRGMRDASSTSAGASRPRMGIVSTSPSGPPTRQAAPSTAAATTTTNAMSTGRTIASALVLQQAEPQQALGRRDDRVLRRTRRPSELAAGLVAGGVLALAELGHDLAD